MASPRNRAGRSPRARSRALNSTAQAALNRGRAARGLRPLSGRVAVGSARARSGGT